MRHFMLDLETLSSQPDAAVFEVAILEFKPGGGYILPQNRLVWRFRTETGHICPETVYWWSQQKRKPNWTVGRREAPAVLEIHDFLEDIAGQDVRLWAKPIAFDLPILVNLLRRHNLEMPIHMGYWRDTRTILELAHFPGVDTDTHDAAEDCQSQINRLVEAWKILSPTNGAF